MRIFDFLPLGLFASLPLHGGAQTQAAGVPPTTDRVALTAMVEQARAARPDDVTIRFEVQLDDGISVAGSQQWTLSWGHAGARMGAFAPQRDPFPGSEMGWQFNVGSGEAMRWGPTGAKLSRDPQSVQVGELPTDYEFFLGEFVMEGALGLPRQKRDLVALLEDPSAVVLPQTEVVAGQECVVVELDSRDADGAHGYAMRGYYGIFLGYAQVRFEIVRGDGGLLGRWDTSKFWSLGSGSTLFPIDGIYENWDGAGRLNSVLRMTVATAPDGSPAITTGMQLQTAAAMPPGAWIQDIDNGKIYQVASDHTARAQAFLLDNPAVRPSESWMSMMLIGAISLAAACVGLTAFVVGARRGRPTAKAASF